MAASLHRRAVSLPRLGLSMPVVIEANSFLCVNEISVWLLFSHFTIL
jgi:hypothetical protein